MTLSGVCVEHLAPVDGCPKRMDVYVVNRVNGKCSLVAKKLLVTHEKAAIKGGFVSSSVTVAANPIQAYQLSMAQKEGSLELAHAPFEDANKAEVPKLTLEEFLGEKTPESSDK
jgi:hypothetical protein